jgi:hypothetical protein
MLYLQVLCISHKIFTCWMKLYRYQLITYESKVISVYICEHVWACCNVVLYDGYRMDTGTVVLCHILVEHGAPVTSDDCRHCYTAHNETGL